MQTGLSPDAMLAALAWQVELGADEAIGDAPVNRYAEASAPATAPAAHAAAPASTQANAPATARSRDAAAGRAEAPAPAAGLPAARDLPDDGAVAEARRLAAGAADLAALAAAMAAFPHCELRLGARSLVFADGNPAARVMVVGEAPGREEDLEGRPFVGRAGQLLDRMFAAIGLSRTSPDPAQALYITNLLPWRPPQNRDPAPQELAMLTPFLLRHIDLAGPEVVVTMGRFSLQALTGLTGITRVRGRWTEAAGRPCLPMLHPAYLLRNPAAKREAWADLLELKARLGGA